MKITSNNVPLISKDKELELIWDEALKSPHADLMADIYPEDDKEYSDEINRKLREKFNNGNVTRDSN